MTVNPSYVRPDPLLNSRSTESLPMANIAAGIVQRFAATGASAAKNALPEIQLPRANRTESKFAADMGNAIGPSDVLFRRQDRIVEIRDEPFSGDVDENKLASGGLKFTVLSPTRARTWVEDYVTTGNSVEEKDAIGKGTGAYKFVPLTMSQSMASSLLVSPQFVRHIPEINRILDVIIPIRKPNGTIITPKEGFNRSLGIYCNPNAPKIHPMSLKDAKDVIEELLTGFAWKNEQSKVHAIARMLTPFCRGLMGFSARTPLWYFSGNRPRAGKDYLAGITQILYLGHPFEDAALGENEEETRKRITAAIGSGRRMMHFANCQGHIQSATFIQAITAPVWRTRALGSTNAESDLELPNEIDYSMSANSGLTYREDLDGRIRKVELAFFEENENARIFPKVFLHQWVTENRALSLSAFSCLVDTWRSKKMPPGATPFNSFPKWAEVVGGIMQACDLGDPCLPNEDRDDIGGDKKQSAMDALYSIVYAQHPETWISKQDVFALIGEKQEVDDRLEWFGDFSEAKRNDACKRAGKAIKQYQNRIINGVRLCLDTSDTHSQRHKMRFVRVG